MRHELTSGAWVEVRPIQDLKRKDKVAVARMRYYQVPLDDELSLDQAAVMATIGAGGFNERWRANTASAVAALVITGWSFDAPLVAIEGGQFANEDSLDELGIDDSNELDAILAPYAEKLTAVPDPKAQAAETTSSSNGRSSAKAPSPAA